MACYFAYGSNMSRARLQARVGVCRLLGAAVLAGHVLTFDKRGGDGSGKCNVSRTRAGADAVWGVLFELSPAQFLELDRHEGQDYARVELQVTLGGRELGARIYRAHPRATAPGLFPFCWYKGFVVHGAREHALPVEYIEWLERIDIVADRDAVRRRANARILETRVRQRD